MSAEEVTQLKEEHRLLKSELGHIKNDISEVRHVVKSMDHAIRGNGKIGLSERVGLLEAAQKNSVQFITLFAALCGAAAGVIALFIK